MKDANESVQWTLSLAPGWGCADGWVSVREMQKKARGKAFNLIFSLVSLCAKWGSNFSFLPSVVKAIMGYTNETNIMTISRKRYEICSTSSPQHTFIPFPPLALASHSTANDNSNAQRSPARSRMWGKNILHDDCVCIQSMGIWMDVL